MALILDSTGVNTANVNSDSELQVQLSKVLGKAGLAVVTGQPHDGAAGLAKVQRPVLASIENRLAVGMDNVLWDDAFSGGNVNITRYLTAQTTMTVAQTGGGLTLNNGGSVATTTGAYFKTDRSFPVMGNSPTTLDFSFALALTPQSQNIIEIGFGIPAAANPYAPTDGIYMQIDTAGALQLVANFNGTPTTSGAITFSWTANRFYHGEIVSHRDRAELWLDGVLYAAISRSAASTAGSLSLIHSAPLYARMINNAATSGAQKLILASWSVAINDINAVRLWATAAGGMGLNSMNAPDGVAAGSTANFSNSAAPTSATLSNTAAGYTTLGGNWQFAAVAGAETDYALFGYQVPAISTTQPGRNLIIRGVRIEAFNMGAAVATTPTLLNWTLGIGSTAVSLATADSGTAATRAPRRIPLGTQSFPIAAAIGANVSPVDINFDAPILAAPGTFVHIILKMPVGTATASQIVRGMVAVNGYWE